MPVVTVPPYIDVEGMVVDPDKYRGSSLFGFA